MCHATSIAAQSSAAHQTLPKFTHTASPIVRNVAAGRAAGSTHKASSDRTNPPAQTRSLEEPLHLLASF